MNSKLLAALAYSAISLIPATKIEQKVVAGNHLGKLEYVVGITLQEDINFSYSQVMLKALDFAIW